MTAPLPNFCVLAIRFIDILINPQRGWVYKGGKGGSNYGRLVRFLLKDCVSMRERLSARTAEQAAHRNAVISTSCDGGVLRAPALKNTNKC
jgi:hypothetical protein